MSIEIASKIKALTPAKGFIVKGDAERKKVLKKAAEMKQYGVIQFDVVTRDSDKPGEFKVFAG